MKHSQFKPIDKFKGFTVTVDINRRSYLVFSGPRLVHGDWYASFMPPGFARVTIKQEWKEKPTGEQLLTAVKAIAPSVRKIYVRNLNYQS